MDANLLVVSFFAGVLTILAPCIFPLLPILIGSSADGTNTKKALRVVLSLLASIAILTLLIHGTSNALNINQGILRGFSGILLAAIGLITVFPEIWERFAAALKLGQSSNSLLGKAMQRNGVAGDILIGASLGPVFSSCSPTYGVIIATVLPTNFFEGTIYLGWYILGLGLMFALIAVLGSRFVTKLQWATDPKGWFKRILGILFVVIGVAILFNFDRSFESWLLNFEAYNRLVEFELNLL